LFIAKMLTKSLTQLFVLFLQQGNTLLKRFQKELFADTRALGMLTIAFAAIEIKL
jgi:hypothetical protein